MEFFGILNNIQIQIMKYTAVLAIAALIGTTVAYTPVVTSFFPETEQAGDNGCDKHEELVGHNCECKKGYIRFRGYCTRCPPEARFSCRDKVCKCSKGYVYDIESNTCREIIEEPKHRPNNPSYGGPQYSQGYRPHNPSYGGPQYGHGQYRPHNSEPSYKSPQYKHPEPSNNNHHYYGPGKSGNCGINERVTPGGGCDCLLGYTRYDGVNCDKCPENGHWDIYANHGEGACVCNWDFRLENGECVPDCEVNERFTAGGGCDCKPGFVRYRGKECMKECPSRSWWNAQEQKCNCEWGLVWDQTGWACVEPKKHHY